MKNYFFKDGKGVQRNVVIEDTQIPRENKDDIIADIQQYFMEELGESIGNLAAVRNLLLKK